MTSEKSSSSQKKSSILLSIDLTFISSSLCKLLELPISIPTHKAVATATGQCTPILGRVTFLMRWGPIKTEVTAHVLGTLLPNIDLIAGDDFLNDSHAVLDYHQGQCTLRSRAGCRIALRGSSTQKVFPLSYDSSPVSPCLSAPERHPPVAEHTPYAPERHPPVTEHPPLTSPLSSHQPVDESDTNGDPISATEAMRYLRRGAKMHLVMVKVVPPTPSHADPTHAPPIDLSHVPLEHRDYLCSLIDRNSSLFASDLPPGLPPNQVSCEVIPTEPGHKPPYHRPFRLSPLEKATLDRAIARLLRLGHIQASTSAYGCPCFFVEKPGGELRQVFDYKALNALTRKNRFPLPRIDDLLDAFHGASIFSSFDLTVGYNQFRLHDSDIPKTAFNTPGGHWEWLVLPMGLSNSPSAFQSAMQNIFTTHLKTRTARGFTPENGYSSLPPVILVYLDDVCLISKF